MIPTSQARRVSKTNFNRETAKKETEVKEDKKYYQMNLKFFIFRVAMNFKYSPLQGKINLSPNTIGTLTDARLIKNQRTKLEFNLKIQKATTGS